MAVVKKVLLIGNRQKSDVLKVVMVNHFKGCRVCRQCGSGAYYE